MLLHTLCLCDGSQESCGCLISGAWHGAQDHVTSGSGSDDQVAARNSLVFVSENCEQAHLSIRVARRSGENVPSATVVLSLTSFSLAMSGLLESVSTPSDQKMPGYSCIEIRELLYLYLVEQEPRLLLFHKRLRCLKGVWDSTESKSPYHRQPLVRCL